VTESEEKDGFHVDWITHRYHRIGILSAIALHAFLNKHLKAEAIKQESSKFNLSTL